MQSESRVIQQLSQAGYRITRPRRAVIRALLEDEGYASPAEVRERARSYYPTIGLVTVYRTLDLLSELGFVRRIHTEEGCHSYAAANHGHHHHLICRHCGEAVEFQGCDLSPFLARISQQTGYSIEDHLLELVGICSNCQLAFAGTQPTRRTEIRR
jgi:Fur family ferric uptake transcriptional regulator